MLRGLFHWVGLSLLASPDLISFLLRPLLWAIGGWWWWWWGGSLRGASGGALAWQWPPSHSYRMELGPSSLGFNCTFSKQEMSS